MLIDGRDVPNGTVLTTDLCIIGSGAAGLTIARELEGSKIDVVLLESGAYQPHSKTQDLYKGEYTGPTPLDGTRMRYFGGTTNHWAGNCAPLDPIDFQSKPYVAHSGWPFSYEDLVPYYQRATERLEIGPFRFDWPFGYEQGAQAPPALESDVFRGVARQISEARFGIVHGPYISYSGNVRLLLWSNAVELLTARDDPERVDAVKVATLSGRHFKVKAGAYVLATGGVEVPRVLLASRSAHPDGLGNSHDLVGRYFADHPNVIAGLVLLDDDAKYKTVKTLLVGSHGIVFRVAIAMWLALQPEALLTRELLSTQITLPDRKLMQRVGITQEDWPKLFARTDEIEALLAAAGGPDTTPRFIQLNIEQEPNPASRVTLGRAKDPLGMPRVEVDWRVTREDRMRILRSARLFAEQLARAGTGRARVALGGRDLGTAVSTDETIDDDALDFFVGTNMHHMGTARMHASPRLGVVDPTCRVHDTKNLYIGGSAVFPTTGASPPTMTIVALAIRLADHLRTTVFPLLG